MNDESCVVVLSGGMDSTVLLYEMLRQKVNCYAVSFNYGQKHGSRELMMAHGTTVKLGVPHWIINLSSLTPAIAIGGSALVSDTEVPEGHYAEDNMALTVVPNRNMMMASIATSIAIANGCKAIALGVHAGDHAVYPDCRGEFIKAFEDCVIIGMKGFVRDDFEVWTPFINMSKTEIAVLGIENNVPFECTWSCYKGKWTHCGKCGTCVERLESLTQAANAYGRHLNDIDKTHYDDVDYWKSVTA